MKFFGSSGIRMKFSRELMDYAYSLGFSLGIFDNVAMGGDFRTSSEILMNLMISAILSTGSDVYFGGNVPTPTLAYAARKHDIGVMVTASHNPPEYNGIKLWNPDGSAFSENLSIDVAERGVKKWDALGHLYHEDMISEHKEAILRDAKELNIKVVVDCANGAGSVITPHILRELGAEVHTINCHPSGRFPGHLSEPTAENLKDLRRFVIKAGADLGIAHDGDADRFIAITAKGKYLNGDMILAVFMKTFGFRKIVAPVDSSLLLSEFGEVIYSKVGDANVSVKMKELGVKFGGENSGTQIFSSWRYTPDAIYSSVKFAEIVENVDIDELISEFPKFYTVRRSYFYEDRKKLEDVIRKIVDDYDFIDVDGYRVNLDDAWFLIRFSGTEPKVRVTVESTKQGKAQKIMKDIENKIKEVLK